MFKIGDTVRVVGSENYYRYTTDGSEGHIVENEHGDYCCMVDFYKLTGEKGNSRTSYNVEKKWLKLLPQEPNTGDNEIKVGSVVERIKYCYGGLELGKPYTVSKVSVNSLWIEGFRGGYDKPKFKLISQEQTKTGETMNQSIVKLFPKTADAVLVERHLSASIHTELGHIIFAGKEKDVLAVAQKKQDAIDKK